MSWNTEGTLVSSSELADVAEEIDSTKHNIVSFKGKFLTPLTFSHLQ